MDNFMFYNPTRIVFGKNAVSGLSKLLKKQGTTKVLLHYGGGSIFKNGAHKDVVAELNLLGIPFVELGGVQSNPRISLVKKGIELVKAENIDFILALGGGSVIDSAKAIGVGAYKQDVWEDLFMTGNPAKKMMGLGVVSTLAATGSESSTSCVITSDEAGYKRGIGGEALLPAFLLLDPRYTYTLSAHQTACGACGIMAHLLERYFTGSSDVEFTDKLLESTMLTVKEFAPLALQKPDDYNARSQLMWAGTMAHNNLLNTGRTGDWASHKIEHELSDRYDIAHGQGLAVIFPAWMRYVYRTDTARFERLAKSVWGSEKKGVEAAEEGINRLESWLESLGLKTRLKELNIDSRDFVLMAKMCLKHRPYIGEFVRLNQSDIQSIYKLAL